MCQKFDVFFSLLGFLKFIFEKQYYDHQSRRFEDITLNFTYSFTYIQNFILLILIQINVIKLGQVIVVTFSNIKQNYLRTEVNNPHTKLYVFSQL